MAREGGIYYAESEANLTINFDTYKYNTALVSSGVIFITTSSYFKI